MGGCIGLMTFPGLVEGGEVSSFKFIRRTGVKFKSRLLLGVVVFVVDASLLEGATPGVCVMVDAISAAVDTDPSWTEWREDPTDLRLDVGG